MVKCLAQGHKFHDRDSNPEQKHQSLISVLLSAWPWHSNGVLSVAELRGIISLLSRVVMLAEGSFYNQHYSKEIYTLLPQTSPNYKPNNTNNNTITYFCAEWIFGWFNEEGLWCVQHWASISTGYPGCCRWVTNPCFHLSMCRLMWLVN